ncbi:MAG: hypothetical protein HY645_00145 [Acidobacteria bacterium]|nr:hypothetical protein [Acidobacteriota bacterium]
MKHWWKRRHRDRTVLLGLSSPSHNGWESSEPRADQKVFSLEIQQALHAALQQLPFEQRTAVVMSDLQGLS